MGANDNFVPLIKPTAERPNSQYHDDLKPTWGPLSAFVTVYIRDQLTLSTWLALGAIAQAGLVSVFGRLAILPAIAVILYRVADAYLIACGMKHNPFMDGVILNKFSSQYPDELGQFGSKPANGDIVVFLIGTKNNHPMGMFAPEVKEVRTHFQNMISSLEEHADEFDFLGAKGWIGSERTTGNEFLTVMYFKTSDGLHKFAHDRAHREGWDWWNKGINNMPHMSIWHEMYRSPKGNWENIYVNSHPDLIGRTTFKIDHPDAKAEGIEPGKPFYVSPIVDARRGLLRTSAGRLSQSKASEHDAYGKDPYENYGKLGYVQ